MGYRLQSLPEGLGREACIEDVEAVCRLYADLVELRQIGFRLTYRESAICPKFHVDRVGIRLVCTYHGQGTEWLEDHNVDLA